DGEKSGPGKLLPYLTADVRIAVPELKNVLLVPNAAFRWWPQEEQVMPAARSHLRELEAVRGSHTKRVVWIEDKDFVRPFVVTVGLSDGQSTEIIGDELKEGTNVMIGR